MAAASAKTDQQLASTNVQLRNFDPLLTSLLNHFHVRGG